MRQLLLSTFLTMVLAAYNQLAPASVSTSIEVETESGRATRDVRDFFTAYGGAIDPSWTRAEIIHQVCSVSSPLFKAHFGDPGRYAHGCGLNRTPSEKWMQSHAIYLATLKERESSAATEVARRVAAWEPLSVAEYVRGRQESGSPAILIVGCGHIVPFSNGSCMENHQHEGSFCVNINKCGDPKFEPYYRHVCADAELNIRTTSLHSSFIGQFDTVVLERPFDTTLQDPQCLINASRVLKVGGRLYIDFHESYSTSRYREIISSDFDHSHNPTLLDRATQRFKHYHMALYLSELGFTEVQMHSGMRSPFAPGLEGGYGDRVGTFITAVWSDAISSRLPARS